VSGARFASGAAFLCSNSICLQRPPCISTFLPGAMRASRPTGYFGQHRTIPALRLKHRSGSCGTASALPKCSIMSGCGTRIVLRGQKPLALCDRCPCFGSLFPPLAALTFAASSIICAFGLASAAPRSPYRHLELCGIALGNHCASRNLFHLVLYPSPIRFLIFPASQLRPAANS